MRSSRAWLACLLLLPLAACQDAQDEGAAPTPADSSSAPAPGMDESLHDEALALVEAREEALVGGDRGAFLDTVDRSGAFFRTQGRWFDNLAQLPVTDVAFTLGDESVMGQVHGEGDLQLPVDFTMRLDGFDRAPVTQRMVWTFVRSGDDVRLADDRNIQVEAMTGWTPAPWDVTEIAVRRSGDVLVVLDENTVDDADQVVSDLAVAAAVVRTHLPRWSGKFVAYDISDVDAIDKMSAMEVDKTSGVAFPVYSGKGAKVAAYRFAVNPRWTGDAWSRGLVFRHELVHVALATTDDRAPTWLVEGVAEYVSRSVLPAYQREFLDEQALGSLTRTPVLEPSSRFYTRSPRLSYATAAVVCEYLAATRGEDVLWDLVATFRTARISTWDETEGVVRRELGVGTKELTRQALAWAGVG